MQQVIDYYAVLGIPRNAAPSEIRRAYRAKAMACHPDRGGSHGQMVLAAEAAGELLNPESRRLYDEVLANSVPTTAMAVWRGVQQSAHTNAASYPQDWEAFQQWLARATTDVQSTPAGRVMSGIIAGMLIGGAIGGLVGAYLTGAGFVIGVAAGCVSGGIVGAIAGASSGMVSSSG